MKKSLSLLCLLVSTMLSAQQITETYYFSNPAITASEEYVTVSFPNTMQSAELGNPQLPYRAVTLLLPPGCEASTVELEFGSLINLTVGELFPKQATRPVSFASTGEFFKNEDLYNSKSLYPTKAEGQLTTSFYRGHSIANVAFSPVVYLPSEKTISYYSSVTVKVSYTKTEKAAEALKLLKDADDLEMMIDNSEEISGYSVVNSKDADDYEILIISTSTYESSFDELRTLYLKQGLISQFKSVSDIYSEMSGVDNQEKIRNYIIQEYTDHSIEYVLLGGDIDVVPYRGFYCQVQSSSLYEDNSIPADIYFSALDGTWNDDNDNNWGEIGEDDLYPEVSVARMPYSNATELNSMLHKTISYQTNPVLGELNAPLLAGEWLYSDPISWGADYVELLVGQRDDNGYTTTGIPETDPYDSLYDRVSTWNANQLIARMNQGASFIYHNGHANSNYVMRLYNSDITNANFSGLNGTTHNYTFIYTHGCICGAFDDNDCIAEKMVTIDNLAVGGCFNSRYGWFNEGQTEGPSLHINREFVDALYTDHYNRYGRAHKESKTATVPWVNAPGQWEEGALRWCFYDCNALVDPALPIWRDDPYEVSVGHESFILPTAAEFNVTAYISQLGFMEGVACVLMDGDNNLLGRGFTDEAGECTIQITGSLPQQGSIKLYVTGYNTAVNEFNITVGDGQTPQMNISGITTDDSSSGNGNGIIENNETIGVSCIVTNTGNVEISNGEIVLSTDSEYITIVDNSYSLNLPVGGDVLPSFSFSTAENTPDQESIDFTLTIDYQGYIWTSSFNIVVTRNVGIEQISLSPIEVTPNPASNYILCRFNDDSISDISIYNLNGNIEIRQSVASEETKIDVSSLKAGIYLLKAGRHVTRLIIE